MANGYSIAKNGSGLLLKINQATGKEAAYEIPEGFNAPKSGLILAEALPEGRGKKLLEIGVNGHAVLPRFAVDFLNYALAHGVDISKAAVESAKRIKNEAGHDNIKIYESDVLNAVFGKFDVIASNPPYSPLPEGYEPASSFDFGGKDGFSVVDRIVQTSPDQLSDAGEVYLILANYLGIDSRNGDAPSLFEKLEGVGFDSAVMLKKEIPIRKDGVTEEILSHIKNIYPGSSFNYDGHSTTDTSEIIEARNAGRDLSHELVVVRAQLK